MSRRAKIRRADRFESRDGRGRALSGRAIGIVASVAIVVGIVAIAIVNRGSVPHSATEAPAYAAIARGDPAPAFAVTSVAGKRIDSNRIDGPIMLEVFATWCPHCQRETAEINELHRRLGDRLRIVAVSGSPVAADHESPATLADVEFFAQRFGVTYSIAYDAGLAVAKRYLQGGFPTIVFINASKRITADESGEIPLRKLLADARAAGVKEDM